VEGSAMYTALYVARDGAIWVGTTRGVSRYNGQAWRHFTQFDGLIGLTFSSITEDATGQLWIGTDEGAVHVDPAALDLSPVSWPSP
jgi:ligand-binding sensor domain-containing protein